jgi:hypothetical protein
MPFTTSQHDLTLTAMDDYWIASYIEYCDGERSTYYPNEADTPENAACKLAIALFQQGVLTKEAK